MDKEIDKILIIDDDEDVLFAAKMLLKKHANQVFIEKDPRKIPFLLNTDSYDVILLDMNYSQDTTSGKEGFYWLSEIKAKVPEAVVIMITAFGDVEMAVRALKEGATDFVTKPWQNEKLIATITAASRLKHSMDEVSKLKEEKKVLQDDANLHFKDIIGNSKAMNNVFNIIDKVAGTDANVLILGENGTGKEMIARALHNKSKRANNTFVSVDMGAITETLFESELFGHKKGAFTDAKDDRMGRFEMANKGSLFLDEIGNLSLPLQSKLLTALQSRQVTRVGSNKSVEVDIRLISATNMNLGEMIKNGSFRQDLLYRLNTVEIHLPPLRDRLEDIPLLVNHFLHTYGKKYNKADIKVDKEAMVYLQKYSWPGNIRELQHAMERALIMADGTNIMKEDFFFLQKPTAQMSGSQDVNNLDTFNLDEVEKVTIERALKVHGGNISRAADDLGLTRAALYRRLAKHEIE